MPGNKSVVSREFRVTITVEEVEAPKVGDVPPSPEEPFSRDAEEFFDEGDYSSPR
jgi:hypothetical protein